VFQQHRGAEPFAKTLLRGDEVELVAERFGRELLLLELFQLQVLVLPRGGADGLGSEFGVERQELLVAGASRPSLGDAFLALLFGGIPPEVVERNSQRRRRVAQEIIFHSRRLALTQSILVDVGGLDRESVVEGKSVD